ncbi:Elf1-domain-containing protein [Fistulina hepatica ATCC 64428]|nr:Elf1-domain-containing protein [Fistulina hepatica ATCC 64428]
MGKRKKSSRKPVPTKRKTPLETTFTCLFCHHDDSVTVRMDRKEGVAHLACKICDQRYQGKVHHLTEPIDVYSEWIDASDSLQQPVRRPLASTSRAPPPAADIDSDDDDD